MKGYRKPAGHYIEVGDTVPVNPALVQVALRPSPNHVFADTWQSDPLNAAVCWRPKTQTELNTEQDAEWQAFLDSPAGKAVKAVALVGVDKGLWTVAELKAKYRSLP